MFSTEKRGCNGSGKFKRMLTTIAGSVHPIISGDNLNFPIIYVCCFFFYFPVPFRVPKNYQDGGVFNTVSRRKHISSHSLVYS